jgi:hypothetical protein
MGTDDRAAPSSFLDGTLKRLQQTSSCVQSFLVTPITTSTRLFHLANTQAPLTAVTERCSTAIGTAKPMTNGDLTHKLSSSFR